MTKLTRLLWALLFCAALPPRAASAETASKDFTWPEITAGTASIEIENTTAKKEMLAVSLSEFGFLGLHGVEVSNVDAGLPRIDEKPFALAPGAVKRYRLRSERHDVGIRPGKYSALLAVIQDGKTLTPWAITITIPGAQPLGSEELAVAATRAHPFTCDWSVNVRLPLAAAIWPEQTGLRVGAPLGVLKRESGPGFAVVSAGRIEGPRPSVLLPVTVSGIRQAGLYKGTLTFPGGKTAALSVLAADRVIFPIAAIFFGIVIGGMAKRWVNVGRALRLFQRDIAALGVTFAGKAEDFRRAASDPCRAYDISADFERQRKGLADNLGLLRLSVKPLDQTNTDYQKALGELKTMQTTAEEWPVFASELEALRQTLDATAARKLAAPGGGSAQPAILAHRELLSGRVLTLEEYKDRRGKVQAAGTLCAQWLSLLQRRDSAGDLYSDLSHVVPANSADRRLLETADPARAFALLWDANDTGALARVESMLERNEATLEALRAAHGRPSVPPAPEIVRELGLAPPTPEQEKKRIEFTVQLGDWLAFAFAVVAGVLTGLTTYYFGKPFGSFADYTTVFLWGLGAKAVVDLASLGLDKAVQAITRQAAGGE